MRDREGSGYSPTAGALGSAEHMARLRSYFRRLPRADADDLSQQTLIAFLEAEAHARGHSDARAYLMGIARFQLYAHHRKRVRTKKVLDAWRYLQTDPLGDSSEDSERDQLHSLVTLTFEALPEDLRQVVKLVHLQGCSRARAAEVLGLPQGTIASRLRRALEIMRVRLNSTAPHAM
jgi:RNA polymerase sigma-70 factor (ECF subfamily)